MSAFNYFGRWLSLAIKHLNRVIINKDETEIIGISKKYRAEVPFIRPKELAEDNAKGIDVVLHVINWLKENNKRKQYDLIMLLQPTSPLRITEDIDKAIELLFFKKTKAVVSVCEVDNNPILSNKLTQDGFIKKFIKK